MSGSTPRLRRVVLDLAGLLLVTVAGALVIAGVTMVLAQPAVSSGKELVDVALDIPSAAALPTLDERSTIHGEDGTLLAVVNREVSRRTVPLQAIPQHLRRAVIAAEDRRFFDHEGYDIEGIARALVANVQAGAITEGGSTITQQLAKSEVGSDRTLERKASELLYAVALERRFTKDELLGHYLNLVYFGSRAYGVAAASEEYFHAHPRDLRVHQSALLAALISAPNSTDPREHPRRALKRRNSVLRAMAEEGYVPASRLGRLVRRPLAVAASSPQRTVRQRHVVDAVERELVQSKAFGATRRDRERLLYYGGLRITTTLDLQMQRAAARVIRTHLPAGAPTAAIATVDPATGNIKAIASGLPYEELKYDLATQGRRQPGSAFKPFVYAAALEEGFPLDVSLTGTSPAYFEGVPGWERDCNSYDKRICGVNNYAGASYGRLNMRDALKDSVNSAAAQLTVSVGAEGVAELAASMNIDIPAATNNRITESIGLGGLDQGVTPLEMASAYGVFANGGKAVRPHLIARVHDASGALVYEADPQAKPVLDPLVSGAMVDLMQSVVTDGTGAGAALAFTDVAGKTGTTSSNVDAWFAGYTPTLSTAVWVGHAEGQVEMPGMTGGALPATIWQDYMSSVVPGATTSQFPDPDLDALADRLDDITVTVPDIRGRTEAEALAALADRKLVGVAHRIASTAPVGTVVWASPQSGGETAVGSTVAFGVSDGAGSPLDFPLYIPPPLSNSLAPSESDAPDE